VDKCKPLVRPDQENDAELLRGRTDPPAGLRRAAGFDAGAALEEQQIRQILAPVPHPHILFSAQLKYLWGITPCALS